MKQHSSEDLENILNNMRDKITYYLDLSEIIYLEYDKSRIDILRAGLKELNDELYFLIAQQEDIYMDLKNFIEEYMNKRFMSSKEALEDVEPFFTDDELNKINQRLFKLNKEIDQKEMENKQI